MKKIWSAPVAIAEQFAANEYVAACGESGVSAYKFECTAPKGTVYYYPTGDGEIDGVYTGKGSASVIGGYSPCGEKHEAPTTSSFYDGFVDRDRDGVCDSGEEAIIWIERGWLGGIRDWHATDKLDMDTWEITKS